MTESFVETNTLDWVWARSAGGGSRNRGVGEVAPRCSLGVPAAGEVAPAARRLRDGRREGETRRFHGFPPRPPGRRRYPGWFARPPGRRRYSGGTARVSPATGPVAVLLLVKKDKCRVECANALGPQGSNPGGGGEPEISGRRLSRDRVRPWGRQWSGKRGFFIRFRRAEGTSKYFPSIAKAGISGAAAGGVTSGSLFGFNR
jgi:hypothetical protein